jgi:hypothetical protein
MATASVFVIVVPICAQPRSAIGHGCRLARSNRDTPRPPYRHKGPLWGVSTAGAEELDPAVACLVISAYNSWVAQRGSMAKVSGTTAVTAGLGALVLANVVLSSGARRAEPQARQDISPASGALVDAGAAVQLRSGAWRHWQAPTGSAAPHWAVAPGPLALGEAPQANIAGADPIEGSSSRVSRVASKHLRGALVAPLLEASEAHATSNTSQQRGDVACQVGLGAGADSQPSSSTRPCAHGRP